MPNGVVRGFSPRQILLLIVTVFLLAATIAAVYFTPSGDSSLRHLTISQGTLTPAFAKATTSYTASVANSVDSVEMVGVTNHDKATLLINGVYTASTVGITGTLAVGSNPFTVQVTAEDNTASTTYTVTITRAP